MNGRVSHTVRAHRFQPDIVSIFPFVLILNGYLFIWAVKHLPEDTLEYFTMIRMYLIDITLSNQFFLSVPKDRFYRRRNVPDRFIFLVNGNHLRCILQQKLHPFLRTIHLFNLILQALIGALKFFLCGLHFFRILTEHFLLFFKLVTHGLRFGQQLARTFVYLDIKNGTGKDKAQLIHKIHLWRIESLEACKFKHTVHFFVRNQGYNEQAWWALLTEYTGGYRHIFSWNFRAQNGILFSNSLSNQPLREFEFRLQIFLSSISKTRPHLNNRITRILIVHCIKSTLHRADFIEDKLDNVFTQGIQRVMRTKNFTDFCDTPYNPVAFLIATLIFNKVLPHGNERCSQHIIVAGRAEHGIIFSFSDPFGKLCVVL